MPYYTPKQEIEHTKNRATDAIEFLADRCKELEDLRERLTAAAEAVIGAFDEKEGITTELVSAIAELSELI